MSTEERVIEILSKCSCKESVQPTHSLSNDLRMDSLDTVEAAMMIEEEFDFDMIEDDEIVGWKTVADVVKSVQRINGEVAA